MERSASPRGGRRPPRRVIRTLWQAPRQRAGESILHQTTGADQLAGATLPEACHRLYAWLRGVAPSAAGPSLLTRGAGSSSGAAADAVPRSSSVNATNSTSSGTARQDWVRSNASATTEPSADASTGTSTCASGERQSPRDDHARSGSEPGATTSNIARRSSKGAARNGLLQSVPKTGPKVRGLTEGAAHMDVRDRFWQGFREVCPLCARRRS